MRCFLTKCLATVTGAAILALALLFAYLQNRATDTSAVTPGESGDARARVVAPSPDARSTGPEPVEAPASAATPAQPGHEAEAILLRGVEVYGREGCGGCHSIGGEGNRRSPLDGVGARLDLESIRGWIVEPKAMNPRVRKPAYDALSEEDLAALIAYLANLRE